ncbi:beta-lactamase family protein [Streptomyces sp. NBC_00249]|uniref:hypothetical protein n=1 Tax=Streptomyces sp. NBC_00249 TaxID=2975690 RepID=UPI00225051DE|nr:hypothetical protein [Streptomyces sp. NBC_00249]MCX5192687.1 beta-lactamase family protein [Streptomyces sp. NBC_00249]
MTPPSEQAGRIEALVRSADPDAVWAAGSADTVHTGLPDGAADTPHDVGGLAAVLALWPVLGSLVTCGELTLHTPVSAYTADAAAGLPAGTTAHHLLTHADGPHALAALTRLAEHLAGSPPAAYAAARIWRPLGMTGTRPVGATLHAPLSDLARFLRHLLSTADHPIPRAWTAESLRIRTGELTPARGLLWHPAPAGVWTHHPADGAGPALWVSPRHGRWAALLPGAGRTPAGSLRTAFREAVFGATTAL